MVRSRPAAVGGVPPPVPTRAPAAITLTKEPLLRVVLTVLRKGTKLHEHRVSGPLTLHVLAGTMLFRTREGALRVRPGEVVVLESALEHEVEALEESAFLLTLVQPS